MTWEDSTSGGRLPSVAPMLGAQSGAGHTIYHDEKRQNFLSVEAGGGWVYQKIFGGVEDNYFAVVFGVVAP